MNLPNMKDAKKRTCNKVSIKYDDYNIDSEMEMLGKDKNYLILTYGCQMNEHDSENIAGIMEDMSYTRIDDMDNADVIIVNTCAFLESARAEAIENILDMAENEQGQKYTELIEKETFAKSEFEKARNFKIY